MEYGEVLYEAMQLPVKQQQQLIYSLRCGIPQVRAMQMKRENCKRQLWVYLKILANSLGVTPQAILAKDRLRIHVHSRWVIWNKMYEDGYSQNMIAEASGFKHNIVQVGMRRISEIKQCPAFDPDLAKMYKQFQNALKNENID